MPFDPTKPLTDAPIESALLRSQFTSINTDVQTRATQAQLAAEIGGSSANTNAVGTLDEPFSDPPVTADLEAIRGKLNEFLLAARR